MEITEFEGLTQEQFLAKHAILEADGYRIVYTHGYITGSGEDIDTYDLVGVKNNH